MSIHHEIYEQLLFYTHLRYTVFILLHKFQI